MNFSLNPFMWGRGEEVGNTTVGNYIIDTCYTFDCGYETGIKRNNGHWVIVEYFANAEKAKEGHQKWCDFCKNNPTEVYSVQTNEIERL